MTLKFFKSISFKIFIVYLLILFIILSLFSASLYVHFRDSLEKKLDSLLISKAKGIEDAIRVYRTAQKLKKIKKGDLDFWKLAPSLTGEELSSEKNPVDFSVSIFDMRGMLLASSLKMPNTRIFKDNLLQAVLHKERRFEDTDLIREKQKVPVRTYTFPFVENGQVLYIIQVAASLVPLKRELDSIKLVVLLRVPIIVLITSFGTYFIIKLTLRPLDKMVKAIHGIEVDKLQMRIHVPDTQDEVGLLGQSFNEMLARLERAFSSQRQIIHDISHELKTPLTILQGQIELGLKKNRSMEEYQSILVSNLEEIEKMKRIVHSILLLAKLDNQGLILETQRLEINGIIRQVVDEMKPLADAKHVEIVFWPRHKVHVNGNGNYIHQVFVNMLENAIKFTPREGRVTVEVDVKGKNALINISDTGVGIDEKDLPYIFDRFYRVDKARSSGNGLGLGLSIAQSIIYAHKGQVRVHSTPKRGTTFHITLPVIPAS